MKRATYLVSKTVDVEEPSRNERSLLLLLLSHILRKMVKKTETFLSQTECIGHSVNYNNEVPDPS